MFYAYVHCKPCGTPFYVGKGCFNRASKIERRNVGHRNIVAKHGKENILVGKFSCSSEEIAFELEKGIIKCLKRAGIKIVNKTDGGEGPAGLKWKEESKKKLSDSKKGTKHTEEWKRNLSERLKNSHPMKGRMHSDAAKAKMSENNWIKKNGHTEDSKLKISEAMKTLMIGNLNSAGNTNNTGKVWINNGIKSTLIYKNSDLPAGFIYGRIKWADK